MESEESPIDIHNHMTFIVFKEECGGGSPLGREVRSKLYSTVETSPFFKLNSFLASKAGVEQTSRRIKIREIELDLAM